MAPTIGHSVICAIDTALPIDASSIPLEIVSESLRKTGTIRQTSGMRGTRQNPVERTRTGTYTVSGTITLAVSRVALDNLLPAILGGSENANVFDFAETLPELYFAFLRGPKMFTYAGCRISRATFRGAQGTDFLELTLEIEGETETVAEAAAFPDLDLPTDKPYIFEDGVFTIEGTTRKPFDFEITIDNVLDTGRFRNSLTREEIPATDHVVTVTINTAWTSDETDLYGIDLEGDSAAFVFTNAEEAGSVLTFAIAALQWPDQSPVATGKTAELQLPIAGTARSSNGESAVKITNAHAA